MPRLACRLPSRILFVKLAEQGRLSWPPRRFGARSRSGAEHVFLVFEENRPILDAMALIPDGNVITIQTVAWGDARQRLPRHCADATGTHRYAIDLGLLARRLRWPF